MNSEISEIEKEFNPKPEGKKDQNRRKGSGLSILAMLLSLIALALSAWLWWQNEMAQGEVEQRAMAEIARLEATDSSLASKVDQLRNELETALGEDDSEALVALESRLSKDRQKVGELEGTIEDQLSLSRSLQQAAESMQGRLLAAEAALSGMSSRELDAGGELDLAEVDYLLRLANERLKLFSDPVAADQALEVADMHLAAIDNPIYLGVRRDISAARRELATVELPDALDVANQLDSLQQAVPALKFPSNEPLLPEQSAEVDDSWWARVKQAFSGLVTVRRSTDQENERISIEDKDFVRQRVWLQLEIAHLAMMRRDQQAFSHALDRVQDSVNTWFDPADEATRSMIEGLSELQSVNIAIEVPDITAPWTTLRAVRAGQSRPPPAPVAEVEGSGE